MKPRLDLGLFTLTLALGPAAAAAPALSLKDVPFRHEGLALSAGGGVTGYVDRTARSYLGTGGYWEVRGLLGARSFLGTELAYVGSARGLGGPGVDDGAAVVGNGAEAGMRLNLPLSFGQGRLTPFLFGGPGFTHLRATGTVGPGMRTHDTALVLTTGAGLTLSYRQVALGTRFTYRQLRGADLIGDVGLNSWSVGLSLGYEL